MSSRSEEKARRREERMAREKAEKARAARRQRLQLALGGVLGAAAIAVVVLLVTGALGGSDGGGEGEASTPETAANVPIPEQEIGDVEEAAKAAGCKLSHPEIEGQTHEDKQFAGSDYKTNPPTSGNHFPEWYQDGVYAAGDVPELGKLVHTLEHGRINVQYKPGTPADTVAQLESLLAEQNDGYHMLLYENTTDMTAQVAATTWGHSLTCPEMNDQVFDALRTFRNEYIDQGPEDVP
ncbi:MAG TPA: DUF3105 domain-containing protein [Solirubrobacteraceae bacterium]|nr:DUF3105 domain-containing protein [Solirubrobacteraceae bacterium]